MESRDQGVPMRVFILGLCLSLLIAGCTTVQPAPTQLSRLHRALNLSADQEAAWQDYARATESSAEVAGRRYSAEQLLPQLTTPRRIALIQATMEQDLADVQGQGAAVMAFYNRLTPDQQAVFDRETLEGSEGPGG